MNKFPLEFFPQCKHLEWLTNHLGGWQFGEQDLLVAIVERLGIAGQVVEIGAGDGDSLPLTVDRLYHSHNCVLFEADYESRNKIAIKYPKANVQGFYSGQRNPLASLVVIDVDSNDSMIMQQVMTKDVPIVVVCEHMDRHYPITTTSPAPIPEWMLGHELAQGFKIQDTSETLHAMASKLGYERIGFNRCNSFFVRRDRFTDLFR